MSLGAELLLRRIVDGWAGDPVVVFSGSGDGSPVLDAAATPPLRMARRPVGGVSRRGGVAMYVPPLDIARRPDDCRRLAQGAHIIVDALASDAAADLARIGVIAAGDVAAVRLRGADARPDPTLDAHHLLFADADARDRVFIRKDLMNDDLARAAGAFSAAEIDEYDALSTAFGGACGFRGLRHQANLAEVVFAPSGMLDQPDDGQIAAVLGDDRVVMSADGDCALVAPQFSAAPSMVSVAVQGLAPDDPDPVLSLPNAPGWAVDTVRRGGDWRARAAPPPGAAPLISVFLDIAAPDCPAAEVVEVASSVRRNRGAWEIWDEAQSQLELEESW